MQGYIKITLYKNKTHATQNSIKATIYSIDYTQKKSGIP